MNTVVLAPPLFVAALLATANGEEGAARVASGPRIGERVGSFLVRDCTGPASGKTLCYYCRYADRPLVAVFLRELDRGSERLIRSLDEAVVEHRARRLAAVAVLVAKDTQRAEARLKRLGRDRGVRNVPLTIYRDDPDKLTEALGLAPAAALTVATFDRGATRASLGFASSQLSDGQVEEVLEVVAALTRSPADE